MGFRRRRWRDLRPDEDKVRVNGAIRVAEVRLINDDGQQLGVMAADTALDVARRVGLDLVEIAPTARPPVCKIMDYGRYKYEQKKKAASAKKSQHQIQLKEIKLRPRIDEHDLGFKLRNARKFLLEGDKVKCTVMFRGRENLFTNLGRQLLTRISEMLSDIATVEQSVRSEGRTLSLVLAPVRSAIEKARKEEASRAASQEADEHEDVNEQEDENPSPSELGDAGEDARDEPAAVEEEPAAE